MSTWLVMIETSSNVIAAIKRLFSTSGLEFDELDGRAIISSPRFILCTDRNDIDAVAHELVNEWNIALRIFYSRSAHIELHALIEKDGDKIHRTMLARGGAYGISGAVA